MKQLCWCRIGALLSALLLLFALTSCKKQEEPPIENDPHDRVSYENLTLSDYIQPFPYQDLTVTLKSENASRSEAIWNYLLSNVEILRYPQEQLDYYVAQKQSVFRHYAQQNDLTYEEVLETNGVSEESILEEAKQIVKGDLLYRYIAEDAKIELTDTEKRSLLDRYVQKYSEQYGYTEEYVKEHMEDLVYDSMLYDKVREYLIVNNHFTIPE